MIIHRSFMYGNKNINFKEDNMFVDYVDNRKDLKHFENLLGEDNYAIYAVVSKFGGYKNYITNSQLALVTTSDMLTSHYKHLMKKEKDDV